MGIIRGTLGLFGELVTACLSAAFDDPTRENEAAEETATWKLFHATRVDNDRLRESVRVLSGFAHEAIDVGISAHTIPRINEALYQENAELIWQLETARKSLIVIMHNAGQTELKNLARRGLGLGSIH